METRGVKKTMQVLSRGGGGERNPKRNPKTPKKEEPEHPKKTEADFLSSVPLSSVPLSSVPLSSAPLSQNGYGP